jgi:hypothetical protein
MKKVMLSQPTAGKTDEEIVSWLNRHIFFESGYDITKGPFPLPATIGEGFRFQSLDFPGKNSIDYVTKAIRKNDKRVLRFRISTFIGLCGGACHYFCKAYSAILNTDVNNPSHCISGYITDVDGKAIDIPSESRSLAFDIGVPLTEEMIQRDMGHYKFSKVGDCGTALRSKDDFIKVIEKLKEVFDMEQWSFEIDE